MTWPCSTLPPALSPAGSRSNVQQEGVFLPEGPYATVAGLVLERVRRLPERGETVQVDGWRLEILAVDRRAITHRGWSRSTASSPAHSRTPFQAVQLAALG
jgi:Mg2+/Co2+ transporter CorC